MEQEGAEHGPDRSGTRGSLADAANRAQDHVATSASQTTHSAAVTSKTAALGTAALLRLSDLPTGWTSGNSAASPMRVTPWSSKLASCVGISQRLAAVVPTKVNSPDFTSADQIDAVEDSVSVFASAAQAEYAALASSKTTGCMNSVASSALQENMQKEAGSTTTVGVVSFAGLPAGAGALHQVTFNGNGAAFPAPLEEQLLTTVEARH
jgi:hypothetical protein